jgi:hypothetical protein
VEANAPEDGTEVGTAEPPALHFVQVVVVQPIFELLPAALMLRVSWLLPAPVAAAEILALSVAPVGVY